MGNQSYLTGHIMMTVVVAKVLATLLAMATLADATSFKMDFLSAGTVRTDPLVYSQIGECLSDHVHKFYGASSAKTMRPGVTYQDLRSSDGNTGNVEENKSLYWNPAIYQIVNPASNSGKSYQLVDIWFASAYYVFETGKARAFPAGLKMKASAGNSASRATAICAGSYPCERTDQGGCQGTGSQTDQMDNEGVLKGGFLPLQGCGELEINIKFPTCWDGVRGESANGDHVNYGLECDDGRNECHDVLCPASHPVKIPELHLYVRVAGYEGGAHVFSDGSDVFHSDYFSGWVESELQRVLDNCENESEAASPDAFCSDWLTFRGKDKTEGEQTEDGDIRSDLETIQPSPVDTRGLISPEAVTGVPQLPRGACSGTLIGGDSPTPAPTTEAPTEPPTEPPTEAPTTQEPDDDSGNDDEEDEEEEDEEEEEECEDVWRERKCRRRRNRGKCTKRWVARNCQRTCNKC